MSIDDHDEELTQELVKELQDAPMVPFSVELPAFRLLGLLGVLQLVLSHPMLSGLAREDAEDLARAIADHLNVYGPATQEVIERGWRYARIVRDAFSGKVG